MELRAALCSRLNRRLLRLRLSGHRPLRSEPRLPEWSPIKPPRTGSLQPVWIPPGLGRGGLGIGRRSGSMAQELYHPEFARAGQQPGLQVWRIEKLELVPVPEGAHGDFFVGDAYLVLHTARASRGFVYRLHFWLGKRRPAAGIAGICRLCAGGACRPSDRSSSLCWPRTRAQAGVERPLPAGFALGQGFRVGSKGFSPWPPPRLRTPLMPGAPPPDPSSCWPSSLPCGQVQSWFARAEGSRTNLRASASAVGRPAVPCVLVFL